METVKIVENLKPMDLLKGEAEMKAYRKPALVSYKSQDIIEIIGPGQAASGTMGVGGGWREASLSSGSVDFAQEDITSGINSPETETINETIV